MFKKVITAEDFDSINIAIDKALNELHINEHASTRFCDETIIRMKKAIQDNNPFELLITDLSFKAGQRNDTITSGQELIIAARKLQPEIPIIVFSVEDRPILIRQLFTELNINGYVVKGLDSIRELKKAIESIYEGNEKVLSEEASHVFRDSSVPEIGADDRELLRMISQGISQPEISRILKESGSNIGSLSSIEKRINNLKNSLRANNNAHLVSIAKDLGLI